MLHLHLDRNTNFLILREQLIASVEKTIKARLIPALFDGFPISEEFKKLLALPCKLGGMGITDPTEKANDEYSNSRELTQTQLNIATHCEIKTSKAANLQLRRNAKTNTLIFQLHCENKCPVNTKD